MNRLPEWLAVVSTLFGYAPAASPAAPTDRRPPPDPLSLCWLAEHLEALAADDLIPLNPVVRAKVCDRIAAARQLVKSDPVSAAWALRQAFLAIQTRVGK